MLDGINQGLIVQAALHEIEHGAMSASDLLGVMMRGELSPPLQIILDARSVFDAIAANPVSTPADRHLRLHLLKAREFIDRGMTTMWWCDTRMQPADGLTKGSIDRRGLLEVAAGQWTAEGSCCSFPSHGAGPTRATQADTADVVEVLRSRVLAPDKKKAVPAGQAAQRPGGLPAIKEDAETRFQ